MAIYKVVKYPDPVLFRKTEEVKEVTQREKILVQDMIETMYAEKGVGLAANQIGIPMRIFVAIADGVRGKELVFLNPEIIKKTGAVKEQEGCLSVPGIFHDVKRYKKVILRGMQLDGQTVEVEAEGILARIFQHEVDHLNGHLFIHRLGYFTKKKVFKMLDLQEKND